MRQSTIGNIEAGLRKRPREILKIAAALGVLPQWLETGEGAMRVDTPPAMEWPFEFISREQWNGLSERQRGFVESAALNAYEGLQGGAKSV